MRYRYVFGPVSSGRLGGSLGLDLLGAPICSMDCLYCEVGRTTALTARRKPYVRAAAVLAELAHWKGHVGTPIDIVTLGGMGEPCLNSEIAQVIAGAKALFPATPVAVLTNATLLTDPQVRRDIAGADVVLPSLDSLVEEEFAAVCRPAPGITAAAVAQAVLDFRAQFAGRIYLEVLLLAGLNDSAENLRLLESYVARLKPHRVDVTTMTRPGAYAQARAVGKDVLAAWSARLNAGAAEQPPGRALAPASEKPEKPADSLTDAEIRATVLRSLRRRPQTAAELAAALGLDAARVSALVSDMEGQGVLRATGTTGPGLEPYFGPASREVG